MPSLTIRYMNAVLSTYKYPCVRINSNAEMPTGSLSLSACHPEWDVKKYCEYYLDLFRTSSKACSLYSPVNGRFEAAPGLDGYARIERTWQTSDQVELRLPMPVERIEAHPNVRQNAGRIALQRGPVSVLPGRSG